MDNLVILAVISLFTFCIDVAVNALLNLAEETEYNRKIKLKVERNKLKCVK